MPAFHARHGIVHRCRSIAAAAALVVASAMTRPVGAQAHAHEGAHEHGAGLHFTHPLFAESISPDSKVRIDYAYVRVGPGANAHELELEGEYAFAGAFSIEAGVHFDPENHDLGETHVLAKFANDAFASSGVLLGYGLELGLPTGSRHAHADASGTAAPDADEDVVEIAPFLNGGWAGGRWEVIAWTLFEIPTGHDTQDEVGTALRYNASVLYRATPRAEGLVEAFGASDLSGPESEEASLNLAPGVRVRPFAGRAFVVGLGVAVPIGDRRAFDARTQLSVFWHF